MKPYGLSKRDMGYKCRCCARYPTGGWSMRSGPMSVNAKRLWRTGKRRARQEGRDKEREMDGDE